MHSDKHTPSIVTHPEANLTHLKSTAKIHGCGRMYMCSSQDSRPATALADVIVCEG